MPIAKGKTNNPNGRPPKAKSLTTMLEKALARTRVINTGDGEKRLSGKAIVTDMIDRALTTGRVRFPDDVEDSVLSIKDWIDFVRWAYERIDGKPPQPLVGDVENPLSVTIEYVNEPYPVTSVSSGAGDDTQESK